LESGEGGDCPTEYTYQGESGPTAVVKRDFTDYPYKYFPLTKVDVSSGGGVFNAVCVKACPS